MISLLKLVSLVALLGTIVPSILCIMGLIELESVKWIAFAGTILWFATTPFWMGRQIPIDADEVHI